MRTTLIAAVALLVGLPTAASAADTYNIDADHSAFIFKVDHLGFGYTYGRFRKFTGNYTIDKKAPRNSSIEIDIDATSIYTNHQKRDKHLRSPDFFNVKQFPKLTFKSTKVKKAGKTWHVTGKFSLHGVTKTVTVKMKQVGEGQDPWKNYRSGFEGSLTIKRSDYGMKKMIGPAGDKVHILISVEGIRKK